MYCSFTPFGISTSNTSCGVRSSFAERMQTLRAIVKSETCFIRLRSVSLTSQKTKAHTGLRRTHEI